MQPGEEENKEKETKECGSRGTAEVIELRACEVNNDLCSMHDTDPGR